MGQEFSSREGQGKEAIKDRINLPTHLEVCYNATVELRARFDEHEWSRNIRVRDSAFVAHHHQRLQSLENMLYLATQLGGPR